MGKIFKRIKNVIKQPAKIVLYLNEKGFSWLFSDKFLIKRAYKTYVGKKLNLKNPQTFNEKLQWLKLYDRKPQYITMVDKVAVKDYVADKIGEEYIIPTLGVYEKFDDIDFNSLPNQFVIKSTHDSGGLVICKDKSKFDINKARKKINWSQKRKYYYIHREWPYKNVKPRIIIEKYMKDKSGYELKDYKFLCFNGEVKCSFVCSDRFSEKGLHVTFFDRDWKVMPFERKYPSVKNGVPKPINYDIMLELAEKLSKNIPFVRVDFYEIDNRVYFGELTFYPGSGFEEFTPEEWDYKLGEWITLPKRG